MNKDERLPIKVAGLGNFPGGDSVLRVTRQCFSTGAVPLYRRRLRVLPETYNEQDGPCKGVVRPLWPQYQEDLERQVGLD